MDEIPNVPDLDMNPTLQQQKIASEAIKSVDFDSKGNLCILGTNFLKGHIASINSLKNVQTALA